MAPAIVAATAADIDALVRLNRIVQSLHVEMVPALYRSDCDPAEIAEFFSNALEQERFDTALALADSAQPRAEAAGFILFEYQDHPQTRFTRPFKQGFVHQIVVDPQKQRAGVGQALMGYMREKLSARGIDRLAADVWAMNDSSRRFFAAQGLVEGRLELEGAV